MLALQVRPGCLLSFHVQGDEPRASWHSVCTGFGGWGRVARAAKKMAVFLVPCLMQSKSGSEPTCGGRTRKVEGVLSVFVLYAVDGLFTGAVLLDPCSAVGCRFSEAGLISRKGPTEKFQINVHSVSCAPLV